jgi:hypothetical protein
VANVALAFGAAKAVQYFANDVPEGVDGSGLRFSQHRLELGKDLRESG